MKILTRSLPVLFIVVLAFWLGRKWAAAPESHETHGAASQASTAKAPTVWTCSMHPQVRLPEFGKCPICFMDLIPAPSGDERDDRSAPILSMSEAARAMAEIETAPVERRHVAVDVRMVGKVDYDESRVTTITAWVKGRLERLFVDYTGVPVKAGDHMLVLYSPSLLTAQEELLHAKRLHAERPDERFSSLALDASREKLRLWGLKADQIREIEDRGVASEYITVYAPTGGIVVHKNGMEGMYVDEGTEIYTIADLTRVWVKLDAYESDLAWLRLGQPVTFETEAYPGMEFRGTIAFIDPMLDERTRSVKVRVNVENESGRLKPGMFVRATVFAQIAEGGVVRESFLAGKWICPMHPDVVSDRAGDCEQCGMPLVKSESLGYAAATDAVRAPLVIPATAPLLTGKRAIVFVELTDRDRPTYEGRIVVLGPRAGDHYIVEHGLEEGERVVVQGNFKIDSALQIQARPSMMSMSDAAAAPSRASSDPAPTTAGPGEALDVPDAFRARLAEVVSGYLDLSERLAADDATGASLAATRTKAGLAAVDPSELTGDALTAWTADARDLETGVDQVLSAKGDIEGQRRGFLILSEALPAILRRYAPPQDAGLHRFYCSMAFDGRGAAWLQVGERVANPYFGAAMLRCGEESTER